MFKRLPKESNPSPGPASLPPSQNKNTAQPIASHGDGQSRPDPVHRLPSHVGQHLPSDEGIGRGGALLREPGYRESGLGQMLEPAGRGPDATHPWSSAVHPGSNPAPTDQSIYADLLSDDIDDELLDQIDMNECHFQAALDNTRPSLGHPGPSMPAPTIAPTDQQPLVAATALHPQASHSSAVGPPPSRPLAPDTQKFKFTSGLLSSPLLTHSGGALKQFQFKPTHAITASQSSSAHPQNGPGSPRPGSTQSVLVSTTTPTAVRGHPLAPLPAPSAGTGMKNTHSQPASAVTPQPRHPLGGYVPPSTLATGPSAPAPASAQVTAASPQTPARPQTNPPSLKFKFSDIKSNTTPVTPSSFGSMLRQNASVTTTPTTATTTATTTTAPVPTRVSLETTPARTPMVRPTPPSAPTSIGIAAGAHSPSTPTKAAPSSFNLMHPSPLNHVSISGANARPTAPPVNRHNIHTSTSASASIARHGVAPVQQLNPTPRPQGSVMSAYPQYTHQGAVSTPTKRPFDSVDINDPHGRFSSKPKIERKFPGPAGALPKLSDNEKNIMFKSRSPVKAPTPDGKKVVDLIRNGLSRNSSFGLSRLAFSTGPEQGYDEDFEMESWRAMLQGRPGYDVRRDGIATLGQRPAGRVDRLIVLIKEVKQSEAETGVTVKDPFGEVQGTIDKSALDLYRDNFAVGVALELQQVPLFKPSSRSVHLIIRQENLVCFRLPNGVALHTQ